MLIAVKKPLPCWKAVRQMQVCRLCSWHTALSLTVFSGRSTWNNFFFHLFFNKGSAERLDSQPSPLADTTGTASLSPASHSPDLTPRPLLMAFNSVSQFSAAFLELGQMSSVLLFHCFFSCSSQQFWPRRTHDPAQPIALLGDGSSRSSTGQHKALLLPTARLRKRALEILWGGFTITSQGPDLLCQKIARILQHLIQNTTAQSIFPLWGVLLTKAFSNHCEAKHAII